MDTQAIKELDPEQERQRLADEMTADNGPDWSEEYKPGTFGCHELLDRTSLAADVVEQYVLSHPACVQNQDWFTLAEQAVAALRELYQRVGEQHLDDKSQASGKP
jgi:hypothetical protein